jgi:pimeloyl-ACP methyl ester carboxylesterase
MRSLRREDGTALFYEEAQGDEPPILLVHGIACDHTHFAPQFEYFARRGHRVVAMDLRGHGKSDKPHQSYTMQLFTDELAWMCAQIGLKKPVVVGHSLGGVVALALAMRYPDLPSAIVMVDAPVVRPAEGHAAMQRFLEQLRSADYREFRELMRGFVSNVLFIPTDDQERKERIVQQMSSAPQHVVVSTFEGMRDYDPTKAGGGLAVPALYVAANEPQPRSDMGSFHEMFPQVLHGKTVGSGHFCQLEVPEQVNAMIDRFLAITQPV